MNSGARQLTSPSLPMRLRSWLTGLVLCVVCVSANALERQFYFDVIDSRSGLLQNSVVAVTQSKEGYIWVATQGGLHLYDGYRFSIYEHDGDDPASLPDGVVSAFAEDDDKRLWVGTSISGVARLDPATDRFELFALPNDAPSRNERESVTALVFDAERGLWIGNRHGLELLDLSSGERHPIELDESGGAPRAAVRQMILASDGALWIASERGLWRIQAGSKRAQRVAGKTMTDVYSVFETRGRVIYAGSVTGLHQVDVGAVVANRIWSGAEAQRVTSIVEDSAARLWLAVPGEGLVIYAPTDRTSQWIRPQPDLSGTLPDASVRALFVDRSGLLWIGGESAGLSKVDPAGATFRFLNDRTRERDQVRGNNLRAILGDESGRLWLGTDGDGLKRYDFNTKNFTYYDEAIAKAFNFDLPHRIQVEAIVADPNESGALWLATSFGVAKLDVASGRASALEIGIKDLGRASSRALAFARDGSLWIGTTNEGVLRFNASSQSWQRWHHQDGNASSLSNDRVLSLQEDRAGRIWVGTVDGLNVIDPADGTLRAFRHDIADPNSLSGNTIRVVHESPDGSFWIGTHSGLNHLQVLGADAPQFTRFLTRDGLPDATVYGILEDVSGRLWLSTNRGISTFDRDASGFRTFSLEEGLQGLEFNGGAFARLPDGRFAFGGTNGMNLVTPTAVASSHFDAPIVFTAVRVGTDGKVQARPTGTIEMAQSDRVVRFEFAALDYSSPARNRFRYQLKGFDEAWVDAGFRHEATYTNLDPGSYTFIVQGSNHDGHWSDAVAELGVQVKPEWWNSAAMKFIYALLGLLVLLIIWDTLRRKRAVSARHSHEIKLREDRLRLALWGSNDEFWDLDMDSGALVRLSASRTRGSQREIAHSVYDWIREYVHADDQRAIAQRLDDHITGQASLFESEQRVRFVDDTWVWVLARGKIVERAEDGRPLRICGTARNITASREAERERRIAHEVISSMGEAVIAVDLEFRFISVNPAFTRITGWQESEVLGRPATLLNCAQHSPEHYQSLRDTLTREGAWRGELWQRRKDGEEFLSWMQNSEVRDAQGARTHYVAVLSDITERKRNEQELRYLANYDTLTGLPNRTLLSERLGHAVVRARRGGRKVGVLFLDLDRFKHVNDSMGHAAGDRMLKAAGARLRENVRDGDTVARIGGDEFTVVLEELVDATEVERVAQKLITSFEAPLELDDGQEVVISPSIGVSLYPDHGQTPTDLLKFADTAMYQAKERGRKTYMVYTQSMDAAARLRATMVGSLRKALERNEFRLVYQPKLSLLDDRITGVEALLRWTSHELGEVSPATFIPVAEETGLIVEIGDWVLVQACAQLTKWMRAGLRDVTMSVNLSVLQLQRSDLTQRLCDILADNDMAPHHLEFELTESMVMANAEQSITTLRQLKAVGVTLSIDDFGTGYSSLSYLKRLPIDTLKIDKEFVGDITTDPDDEAITATVITMAHSLGLNVIAEGVETAEQVEYLTEQGCDEIQGHWLSKPLPPDQCFAFLRDRAQRRRAVLGGPA